MKEEQEARIEELWLLKEEEERLWKEEEERKETALRLQRAEEEVKKLLQQKMQRRKQGSSWCSESDCTLRQIVHFLMLSAQFLVLQFKH